MTDFCSYAAHLAKVTNPTEIQYISYRNIIAINTTTNKYAQLNSSCRAHRFRFLAQTGTHTYSQFISTNLSAVSAAITTAIEFVTLAVIIATNHIAAYVFI